ncbi:Septin 4, partial [Clydaea vesicula]
DLNNPSTASTEQSLSPTPSPSPPSPIPEVIQDPQERLEAAKNKLEGLNTRLSNRATVPSNIGSFRISIVGDSGIGKTCFVQSLLSIPEITLAESLPKTDGSPSICEVRASTIPSQELHVNEEPLNLTFIDTPGFGSIVDTLQVIRPVVDYHQQQFTKTDRIFNREISSTQLQKFLKAVFDIYIYVLKKKLK